MRKLYDRQNKQKSYMEYLEQKYLIEVTENEFKSSQFIASTADTNTVVLSAER